jgi:hypothetical protein
MSGRKMSLEGFLHAAEAAFTDNCRDARSRSSLEKIFRALATPAVPGDAEPQHEDVRDRYLKTALTHSRAYASPEMNELLDRFIEIEPNLHWQQRIGDRSTMADNSLSGNAGAMIFGPGGLEKRSDVWLGVTVLTPDWI